MALDLDKLVLKSGGHRAGSGEYCVMEATAAYLDLPHSDRDVDEVCPRIEAYARALNDYLPDDKRQELKRFIPRFANTKSKSKTDNNARCWMLQEQATRWAGKAMRAVKLDEWADKLEAAVVTDEKTSKRAAKAAAAAAKATVEAAKAAWAAEAAAEAAWAAKASAAVAGWAAKTAAAAAKAAGAAWAAAIYDEAIMLLERMLTLAEEQR